jgi:RHS repeat-associated protein
MSYLTKTTQYLYDGWNVIEEHIGTTQTNTLQRTYVWGVDLSGSLQGAGGVGGLLMAIEQLGGATGLYSYHYDANGNVTNITSNGGTLVANYRYDVFGNTLAASGNYASLNKYRFSTKPIDEEIPSAKLYYYGYRFYSPDLGRFISRDPIEERGGINLYGFVGNNTLNAYDVLGKVAVINNARDALRHWKSKAGGKVQAGPHLIAAIKNSWAYNSNKTAATNDIAKQLGSVPRSQSSGSFQRPGGRIGVYVGSNAIGNIDLSTKKYTVKWSAGPIDSKICKRTVKSTSSKTWTFHDLYQFVVEDSTNTDLTITFYTDFVPGVIAGDGEEFIMHGSGNDTIEAETIQYCGGNK